MVQIIELLVLEERAVHLPRLRAPKHEREGLVAILLLVKEVDCLVADLENGLVQGVTAFELLPVRVDDKRHHIAELGGGQGHHEQLCPDGGYLTLVINL